MLGPVGHLRTGRLVLRPVSPADGAEIAALKADPRVYAPMLGGVRLPQQAAAELAADLSYWASHGVGMWTARLPTAPGLVGLVGVHDRPDGLGTALRFAFRPEHRGQGLAREAAGAALRYAHDQAGLPRVIAVARWDNVGSRTVLGAIGMTECGRFLRDGDVVLLYESVVAQAR